MACFLLFSLASNAQFRLQSNTVIGQTYEANTETGIYSFLVHFNTDKPVSSYTETTVSFSKCQTQRGLQVKVYTDSTTSTTVVASDFKCDNYGSNGNPVYVASTDSLIAIMKKYSKLNATTADSLRNAYWKPAACLFDVIKGDTTNQAFGCYPGKYKHVEYGFQFGLTGFAITSDLSFTIDTYDPGNTGKTATYQLIAYLGSVSSTTAIDTIENFYVTGSGKKEVKLAKLLGIDSAQFNNKVYILISTQGTGTPQVEGVYDPIIIFDDFKISWSTPEWVSPAATSGIIYNQGGIGIYSPYTVKEDPNNPGSLIGTVEIILKDKGRVSALTIINDVENPPSQYQFLSTGRVWANDGTGNYTIPVEYTFTPSTLNAETGNYTDSYITIPAPSGKTDDDIKVLMTFKPKATDLIERIEINNGIRFWWDVQTKAYSVAVSKAQSTAFTIRSANGKVYVNQAEGPVVIYSIIGKKAGSFTPAEAAAGISLHKGLWMVTTSKGTSKIMIQ